MEHVGSNLGRIVVPLASPVTIDFPARTGEPPVVGTAPLADRVVRGAKTAVRTEVARPGDRAGWRRGTHDLARFDKWPKKLNANFQPDARVPIKRDVSAGSCGLSSHRIPDEPAAFRNHSRKLGSVNLPPHDGEWNGNIFAKMNGVVVQN
jgi:hypothetical protein